MVKSENISKKSFHRFFPLFVQRLQVFFTQGVVAVFKFINSSVRDVMTELGGSMSKCEAAAKGRIDRLLGDLSASFGPSAAVPKVSGSSEASGMGLPK